MGVRLAQRERTALAVILVVSVLLRLAVALYLGESVPTNTDETSYHALGQRLVAGYGYSFPVGWYPFTPPDTPTSHWSFLYSAFLAAVYFVAGPHATAGRIAGAILGGLLLPWLTYRFARRLVFVAPNEEQPGVATGGRATSARATLPLVAAGLAAVYPYFVLYAAMLLTETFYICALLWSLERSIALEARLRSGGFEMRALLPIVLPLGLALAAATLIRQSILPWVAASFLYLLWAGWRAGRLRQAFSALLLAGLIILTAVLPFTLRNLRAYDGNFLLLNSNAGYAMYSAQHPMHGTSFQEYGAAPLPEELADAGLNEAQWDKELMRRGIGFVLTEPGRYLLLSLSRVRDYFEFWPTPDSSTLFNIGRVLSIGALLPFMLAGIIIWLRPGIRRAYGLAMPTLPLLFMAFYSVLHIFTWAMARYRLPVDAVALPFAALSLLALRDVIMRRRGIQTAPERRQRTAGAPE